MQKLYMLNLSFYIRVILLCSCFIISIEGNCQEIDTLTVVTELDEWDETEASSDADTISNFDFINADAVSEINRRSVDQRELNRLSKDEDFWYVKEKPDREEIKPQKNTGSFFGDLINSPWFKTLLWIIVVGSFIVILIWFLLSSNIRLFKKQSSKIDREDDLITENIFEINYDKEIEKAIAAGNYRLAIRLMYLQLLKDLSEKNIIKYKQERTNSDYVMQLYSTSYYKDFFSLTRNFEYAWYGQFEVGKTAFHTIQSDFSNFKQRLQ